MERIAEGFELAKVDVVRPVFFRARHERGGDVVRLVVAAGDVDDAALDLLTFSRTWNEGRFFNDVGFDGDEFCINDVVAEILGGFELSRYLRVGFELCEECIDESTNGITSPSRIQGDRAV